MRMGRSPKSYKCNNRQSNWLVSGMDTGMEFPEMLQPKYVDKLLKSGGNTLKAMVYRVQTPNRHQFTSYIK